MYLLASCISFSVFYKVKPRGELKKGRKKGGNILRLPLPNNRPHQPPPRTPTPKRSRRRSAPRRVGRESWQRRAPRRYYCYRRRHLTLPINLSFPLPRVRGRGLNGLLKCASGTAAIPPPALRGRLIRTRRHGIPTISRGEKAIKAPLHHREAGVGARGRGGLVREH